MIAVIQRVAFADVTVADICLGSIGQGLVVLLGVAKSDTPKDASYLANKILNLRLFEDEQQKLNRSVLDVKGELMIVSQFTLLGNCRKGRRPSFDKAAAPTQAKPLYEKFVALCKSSGLSVVTGEFQATMLIRIHNQGPVTLIVNSDSAL